MHPFPARKILIIATAVALSFSLAACNGGFNDVTGSIGAPSSDMPQTADGMQRFTADWGKRYDSNPTNKAVAMNYARGLRATARYAQAVAVLQQAAIKNPEDLDILGAYGKALADAGRLQEAADVLSRAHTPERPNWSVLSAQGSVADQLGDHQQAQAYYQAALKLAPNEPTVLSNLGLSYALSKQLPLAEQTLQTAVANPRADSRVRQNLALVLGLEGKFDQAQKVASMDLPPADAVANVTAMRQMIAQSDTWRDIKNSSNVPRSAPASAVASAPTPLHAHAPKAVTAKAAASTTTD